YYAYIALWSDKPFNGPLLIRALDLVNGQRVIFVGQYAAGQYVGSDVLDGKSVDPHLEFVIPEIAPPYAWLMTIGVKNVDNCEGWQFDAPGFSEVYYA
ncbi:MAG TPA: hypothetical protein VI384_05350, partial [Candidatus Dormibacteraeota bacterium]